MNYWNLSSLCESNLPFHLLIAADMKPGLIKYPINIKGLKFIEERGQSLQNTSFN